MGLGDKVMKELRARFNLVFFPRQAGQIIPASPESETEDEQANLSRTKSEDNKVWLWPKLTDAVYDWHIDGSTLLRAQTTSPLYRGRKCAEHAEDLCKYMEYVIKRTFWTAGARVVTVNIDEPLAPIAKAPLTYSARYKNTVDIRDEWPVENPFEDMYCIRDMDMNSIWTYGLARAHLIEYVTARLVGFKDIPEDRKLVIDGAVVRKHCDFCCQAEPVKENCPLPMNHYATTCISISTAIIPGLSGEDMTVMNKTVRYVTPRIAVEKGQHPFGCGYPPAEGELKVFSQIYAVTQSLKCLSEERGMDAIPVRKTLITSVDGDCIFIALMQWFMRMDKITRRFVNRVYIQRKQSLGTEKYLPEIKRLIAETKGIDPNDQEKIDRIRDKVVFCSQYVDMNQLHWDVTKLLECCRPKGASSSRFYPIETLCLLASLEGNDYVRKVPSLCFKYFLSAYLAHHEDIGVLVSVAENDNEIPVRKIRVHMPGFLRLLYHGYVQYRKSYAVTEDDERNAEEERDDGISLMDSKQEELMNRLHMNVLGSARKYMIMYNLAEKRRAKNLMAKHKREAAKSGGKRSQKTSLREVRCGKRKREEGMEEEMEGGDECEMDGDEGDDGSGSRSSTTRKGFEEPTAKLESAYVIAANAAYYLTYIANGANPYYIPPLGTETRRDTRCDRELSIYGYAIKNKDLPISKSNVKIADEVCMDTEFMECAPVKWRTNLEDQCSHEMSLISEERTWYVKPEAMQLITEASKSYRN